MSRFLLLGSLILGQSVTIAAWKCVPISEKTLHEGIVWKKQNCSIDGVDDPQLVINSVHIDLARDDILVVPGVASKEDGGVATLPAIADEYSVAGINGGYFWRVDMDGFWRDNVCHKKVRKEAEQDANPLFPNFGIGDGIIKINGELLASNCNCTGYSRPVVLKLESQVSASSIEVLYRGEQVDDSVNSAIGAGPNLVSFDAETGESFVDIPVDDDNINRLVYEATTAVGIIHDTTNPSNIIAKELVMVTTDGSDSCRLTERYCGLEAVNLASLMKEVFLTTQAMSMDQGGSTTMWIAGENPSRNGIVSRSDNKIPEEQEGTGRQLANGLFVKIKNKNKKN